MITADETVARQVSRLGFCRRRRVVFGLQWSPVKEKLVLVFVSLTQAVKEETGKSKEDIRVSVSLVNLTSLGTWDPQNLTRGLKHFEMISAIF